MQPVIGITTYKDKNEDGLHAVMLLQAYVDALVQAGSTPVLIPSGLPESGWSGLYDRLDGILFSGGGDIAPQEYHGEDHPRIDGIEPERDTIELKLLEAAVEDRKPFFGICRGAQLVNVGMDGTLYSHIPDQHPGALDHAYPGKMRTVLVHEVKVEEGSQLAALVKEPLLQVNSLHHQGINMVPDSLRISAYAPDGLVEAVELPGHPFGLAVQWHPEWLTDQQTTRELFKAFVMAAGKSKD